MKEKVKFVVFKKQLQLLAAILVFIILCISGVGGNLRRVEAAAADEIHFVRGQAYDSEGNRLILKGNSVGLGPAYGVYDIITQVVWESSNSSIMRFQGTKTGMNCNVVAVSPGLCSITATTISCYYLNGLLWDTQVEKNLPHKFRVVDTISSIKLGKTSLSMNLNSTAQLTYTTVPSDVYSKYMSDFGFRSSNTKVATVDANGKITAVGAGTATITAGTSQGVSASCKVTVKRPAATGMKLNKTKVTLGIGEMQKLTGTLSPTGASGKITWSSSNSRVASVSSNGSVKAKAAGKATITAKLSSGIRASCTVTVIKKPTSIKLSSTKLTVVRGKTKKLTYSLLPKGASSGVTWSSSNTRVASVSAQGVVKGVKVGTASITVKTSNGKKAVCKVTVSRPAATAVKLNAASLSMSKRQTKSLTYTLTPKDAAGKVTWSSSNTKVATVNSKGTVTAKAAGTATITAKVSSKVYARCKVKVDNKVSATAVSIKAPAAYVEAGKTIKLSANAAPSDTTDKIVWSSSNASVASVSSNGTVRGIKEGGVTITARAGSVKKTCNLVVAKGVVCDLSKSELIIRTDTVQYGYGGKKVSYTPGTSVTVVQSNPSVSKDLRILADKSTQTPIKVVLANINISNDFTQGIYVSGFSSPGQAGPNIILELMSGTKNKISSNNGITSAMPTASNASYLIIQGSGSLEIHAGWSAIAGDNITIKSGNLALYSTRNGKAAVIGGSRPGADASNISIQSGAHVKAYGGYCAVGGGMNGVGKNISIAEGSLIYEK